MTTRTLTLELTAKEAAVFSTNAGTQTTHLTAMYPKGANLLGWVARILYDKLSNNDVRQTVFHSGKVRFSDAVRITGKGTKAQPVFPNPAILLEPKHQGGEAELGRESYNKRFHFNDDGVELEAKPQAEAVKGKLVTLLGAEAPTPILHRRLRSAKNGGKNVDAALFDFQSIQPGQAKFRATIECDDVKITDEEWNLVKASFNGTIQIGRGHVTTYGGSYHCEILEEEPKTWPERTTLGRSCTKVRLWLLSDTAFINEFGSPNLAPSANDFGLDEKWTPLNSETVAMSRRIWPWNGAYSSRDMEYAVIEAGSVFTFVREEAGEIAKPFNLVGVGQERGFGRVAVIDDDFVFISSKAKDEAVSANADDAAVKSDPFILWLKNRDLGIADVTLDRWAHEQAIEAKRLVGIAGREGPTRTQWRNLFAVVDAYGKDKEKNIASDQALFTKMLGESVQQACWDANYCGLDTWVKDQLFPNRSAAEATKYKKHIKAIIDKAVLAYGEVGS